MLLEAFEDSPAGMIQSFVRRFPAKDDEHQIVSGSLTLKRKGKKYLKQNSVVFTVNEETLITDCHTHGPDPHTMEVVDDLHNLMSHELQEKLEEHLDAFDFDDEEVPQFKDHPYLRPFKNVETGEAYHGQWLKGLK